MAAARIDFYLLAGRGEAARGEYCCRLVQKAWSLDLRVHVRTATAAEADALDERLWTFAQGAFIPHERAGTGADAPVLIAAPGEPLDQAAALLVNLTDEFPDAGRYQRVAELVDAEPARLAGARERYRRYQAAGHELHKHDIGGAT